MVPYPSRPPRADAGCPARRGLSDISAKRAESLSGTRWPSPASDQAEDLPDPFEGVQGLAEVLLGVIGGDDRAHTRAPLGHSREDEGGGEHALLPQRGSES